MKIISPDEASLKVPTDEKFISDLEAQINYFLSHQDYSKSLLEVSLKTFEDLVTYKKWFDLEMQKAGWNADLIQRSSNFQDQTFGGCYIEFSPLGNLPLGNSTLYKLIRTDNVGYDEYDSVLIRAKDLEQAWGMAEAFNISQFNAFCVEIKEKGDPEVIISSFNVG